MGEVKEILLPRIYTINVLVYKEQWLKLEKGCELWYFITFAWDKQKAKKTNINPSEENISKKELNIASLLHKIKKLTKSCIAAIPKPTVRSLSKLIDVKTIAFLYLNISMPVTTASSPVKTNFAANSLSNSCWMRSTQPPRCMCSTVMFWNTRSWHHSSRCTGKSVPFRCQVLLIASKSVATVDACSPRSVV